MEPQPPPSAHMVHRPHVEYRLMLEGSSRDEGSSRQIDLSSTLEDGYFQVTRVREKVVDCHIIDGCDVLIERTGYTVPQLFKAIFAGWENEGPERKRWWLYIKNVFYSVYRNIILGLQPVYSLGYYCGRMTTDGDTPSLYELCPLQIFLLVTSVCPVKMFPTLKLDMFLDLVGLMIKDQAALPNRKGKEKVSEIADTILSKGVCSELRMACEWYWWHTEEGPHDRYIGKYDTQLQE
ncbi:hypothetical protein RHMOL_Rhmol01G0076200 [Rhododendron molle]|uniref:Uncharacterized protein n=1 Tax=Rhododendron molle TaxID=49168 RepID=A0ACC0PYT8_RHOML|nr:hypothetical protein RHMOL_Rhmol01G0076200 [Rhododendron molle]